MFRILANFVGMRLSRVCMYIDILRAPFRCAKRYKFRSYKFLLTHVRWYTDLNSSIAMYT